MSLSDACTDPFWGGIHPRWGCAERGVWWMAYGYRGAIVSSVDGNAMARLNRRKEPGSRGPGRPTDITPQFRDMVTDRAMELRMNSYTLEQAVKIVNEEFGDALAFETVRRWIEQRIKPRLDETAEAYRQHLLDQLTVAKRAVWQRVKQGDDKAIITWTRLVDREIALTGVQKPLQVSITTNTSDSDALEVQRMLRARREQSQPDLGGSHVIQGEVVRSETERS